MKNLSACQVVWCSALVFFFFPDVPPGELMFACFSVFHTHRFSLPVEHFFINNLTSDGARDVASSK